MKSKKNLASVILKALICVSAVLGILLQCGVFSRTLNLSVLTYFTMMSNIGCAIYYGAAAIHQYRHGTTFLPSVKGALQMCITVTGVVYHVMLSGRFEMQGTLALSNTLLHYVVPIAANLNWLIFDEKRCYTWKMAFAWTLAPLAYAVFVAIAVALGATLGPYGQAYPYYFMDPAQVGGVGMLLLIDVIMGVCFLLMGLLIVAIDRWLGRKKVTTAT